MSQQTMASGVYTISQLEQLGKALALRHNAPNQGGINNLLLRLHQNEDVLRYTYKLVSQLLSEGHKATPAGEWLLDNFHVIEEQIRTSKLHLPKKYSRELPMVHDTIWKYQPRVYVIARELIYHTDGHLETDSVQSIVRAYQDQQHLRLGELWAFPIMLRLGLIDNLRSIAESIAASYVDQYNAKFWAERIAKSARHAPEKIITDIAELAASDPRLSSAFISEFARGVQTHCHLPSLPMGWVEQKVSDSGLSVEHHQNLAAQDQAHDQLSIANSISSLRFLSRTDWRDFVEEMSKVEATLKKDPTGIYHRMDFASRDAYRHRIEYISKHSEYDELSVATEILRLACDRSSKDDDKLHIGSLLFGKERYSIESQFKVKRPLPDQLKMIIEMHPFAYYIGFVLLFICASIALPLQTIWNNHQSIYAFITIGCLFTVAASQAAIALTNWMSTAVLTPKPWPRLNFEKGIPVDARTAVVVPCMLNSCKSIERLISDLEVRFLGNRDKNLSFVLLTDFCDATLEVKPDDHALLQYAERSIQGINKKYNTIENRLPFFLFHRPRLWNPQEGIWMGYERKRGKLSAFNDFLLKGDSDAFMSIVGDTVVLKETKYVITLDADSTLPRDTAKMLIGTLAHPINRPKIDPKTNQVVEGYGILQPRVTNHLQEAKSTRYMHLFSDDFGIDPYTKSVSDVYQDLFAEGSFIGKGIYDVFAFQTTLKSRFPENRILSHDLIESCYARSGLVSDVQLIEEYPSSHAVDAGRRHRWIRGDWQIAAWLLPKTPSNNGIRTRNTLSALSKWKIFDNLRRSIVPICTLLGIFASWLVYSDIAAYLSLWLIVYLEGPRVAHALLKSPIFSKSNSVRAAMRLKIDDTRKAVCLLAATISFLPFEAFLSFDAGFRSTYRQFISKDKLLQWQPSTESAHAATNTLPYYLKRLSFSVVCSVILASIVTLNRNTMQMGQMLLPIFICASWTISPILAWWLSQPIKHRMDLPTPAQMDFLRVLSRRTWLFFERFMNEGDNWLPPDNFQEFPVEVVAHRTSPTNIGLNLLAVLAALDFGYITLEMFTEKLENVFRSLAKMTRYKGHFYNWYDTQTLEPLLPHYISTVDSGNFLGSLIVLRQGLNQLAEKRSNADRILEGLKDTMILLRNLVQSEPTATAQLHQCIATAEITLDDLIQAKLRSKKSNSSRLDTINALGALRPHAIAIVQKITPDVPLEIHEWSSDLAAQIQNHLDYLSSQTESTLDQISLRLKALAAQTSTMMYQDYTFLFNESNKLLSIGFHVLDARLDQSYYDLLASEARISSFLAISQGQIPQEHWFALGRQLTRTGDGQSMLLSWTGSMFEYLMPLLILPTFEGTLIDLSCRKCISSQIAYAKDRNIPWGISESGYNLTDAQFNYQYRAFGVPGLGFKRGLEQDLVIAPYACVMALMLEPKLACANLEHMTSLGFQGKYGFYEAIDFTASRLPAGEKSVKIKSFMAHHQGMAFLSLAHFLLDQPMQKRIELDPAYKATELLLHERMPKSRVLQNQNAVDSEVIYSNPPDEESFRIIHDLNDQTPEVHLLGNGRYHVMISAAGGGYSSWNDTLITRWREDRTQDAYGYFIYLKEIGHQEAWSIGFQPTKSKGDHYRAIFSEGRAEFRRTDRQLESHLEIAVSPDHDAEIRRLTLTNRSSETKVIELTTYAEIVLAPINADLAHPAFSNLFIETEASPKMDGILAHRRPRQSGQSNPWLYHAVGIHGCTNAEKGIETNRANFIGRCRTAKDAAALHQPLSNTTGAVLDPIFSIRKEISIPPGQSAVIDCVLGLKETKTEAIAAMELFLEKQNTDRVLDLAWTHGHVLLRQLNCSASDAILYGKMAGILTYGGAQLKTTSAVFKANSRPLSALWSYGISGDLPIILLRVQSNESLRLVQQVVRGHDYWRRKGLAADLVIWNEDRSGYRQELHDRILEVIAMGSSTSVLDKPGGIFIRRPEQMPDEDRIVFQATARLIVSDQFGSLGDQINAIKNAPANPPKFKFPWRLESKPKNPGQLPDRPTKNTQLLLEADNGYGGFRSDGREYIIRIRPGQNTPTPWCNVLANPNFGTLVSETGSAYTWSENSHEHRLTPWLNDPVSDPSGEAVYIRDELSEDLWSATPYPRPAETEYIVRHGFGYSVYATAAYGITSEQTVFVPTNDAVKIITLKLTNTSSKRRTLTVTSYFDLVLGEHRSKSSSHIFTESDPNQGVIFGRNLFAAEFRGRVAFLTSSEPIRSFTGDRTHFIGRNSTLACPAGLHSNNLNGIVGAHLDPCLAVQVDCTLAPGATTEISFCFGAGRDHQDARRLARLYRSMPRIQLSRLDVDKQWNRLLGKIEIKTPDQHLDFLANGWLLYQTISSRIWGRTGFYQSGGAYGFRDQLQDMMAVVYVAPEIAREHIIRCASRQFPEGDVQHWWHPPLGRGVRTSISDDYLWLPYVTDHYIKVTGDRDILNVITPYLHAKSLHEGEESDYSLPIVSDDFASLYQHCVKAIEYGFKTGERGLPLMGCGDWNDGMNQVGIHGKGESVWLGFFLIKLLHSFSSLAEVRSDHAFANTCRNFATMLKQNINENAWDGKWYRRAYFDDGTPLGSAQNQECRIDSLPQSWAALSGGASESRAKMALNAVYDQLVSRESQTVRLFNPPFDHQQPNPGYISGYIRGVRENGGQYTHAALWVVMAFAQQGEIDRAMEILNIINPIKHGNTPETIAHYKVEPYVVAADVYTAESHLGRGGWTWYTGSSSWFYRTILETFAGFDLQNDKLAFTPKLPSTWPGFQIKYLFRETNYQINVKRNDNGTKGNVTKFDGIVIAENEGIQLTNDYIDHVIDIEIGSIK